MKNRFKFIFFTIIISLFSHVVFANPRVEEYVLEDGMHVYVLEDFSSALVRIEFTANAGFSKQTPDNAGFFPLYTNLLKYASPANREILSSLESECNADSARYVIYAAPREVNEVLKALSSAAFDPVFSDRDIIRELESSKKSVTENAFSVEGFINSSIDSRVYAESPWKHDSGIYPTIFAKTNASLCRVILDDISKNYYRPKNCALFISGPVTKEMALSVCENTFGKALSASVKENVPDYEIPDDENDRTKLFVLTDPEFSPDMTQIVVQYKSLQMEECDYAAQVLDNNTSLFKTQLISSSNLGIRHPQYINAAGTHKNNSSRLIIQALMENLKTSPCQNAIEFVNTLESSVSCISDEEFESAGELLCNSFDLMLSDSSKTMELLSQFWAVKDYNRDVDYNSGYLVENFYDRPLRIAMTSLDSIKRKVAEEKPYVFVLVNSNVLKKYKKEFEKNGFEIVTVQNGSWYTQKLYSTIKESIENDSQKLEEKIEGEVHDTDLFLEKNEGTIAKYELVNKIPVYVKQKDSSNTVSLCVVIDGGEVFNDKNEYGLESVIVDTVALKARSFLYQKYIDGKIKNFPEVFSQTDLTSSAVYVECASSDLIEVTEAFADAFIFTEFTPAMVDPIVLQRKSNQIVKTSSPVFQLESNAVSVLYKNKEYQTVYSTNQDILKKINFARILESSTKLFNASRYKIIIAGNVEGSENSFEKITSVLNETFGIISAEEKIAKPVTVLNAVKAKVKKVKLVHLFLTDVSKEKAGPRPQVLIPTTEFLDPAQFWIKNECGEEYEAVFNALLNDFCALLQQRCSEVQQKQKMIVMNKPCSFEMCYGNITIVNVKNSSTIDGIYEQCYSDYMNSFGPEAVERIKANWIKKYLSQIQTNSGTCLAVKAGLDSSIENPEKYLSDYKAVMNADAEVFAKVFESFEFDRALKLYSADTKK